jgi:hypothetical protein
MKRAMLAGVAVLACLALVIAAAPATAMMIAPSPIPVRVALSEAVVVGKVTSIEEKTVSAPRFLNDTMGGEYKIAVVKIEDAILGAKDLTHVKVGFLAPQAAGPGPILPGRRFGVSLAKDQEVCLFLKPHFKASFLTVAAPFDVIDKKGNPNYEKEVAEARRCAKLLADPKASLESKKADDRFLTAAMLLARYNTPRIGFAAPDAKREPIDAAESKGILLALAEADWNPKTGPQGFMLNPQGLFMQHVMPHLTEKDGWNPPMTTVMGRKQLDFKALPEAARKWLKDNADTYRLQRIVEDKKDDKEEKKEDK